VAPFIDVRALEYVYTSANGPQVTALQGVDLAIERGTFVALIGPNGSGKTTLAHHLNGLLTPTRGEVHIDGLPTSDPRHLRAVRQRVGMLFQNPDNQIVASTVEEDVAFGPENLGLPAAEIRRRVEEALDTLDLQHLRTYPPQRLSGGQKQRVAIAGVLATRCPCLVLDEPSSMLDGPGRHGVMDTVRRLNREAGLTVIWITQCMEEAVPADRLLVMHQGQVRMDGPPGEIFERTAQLRAWGLELPAAAEIAHRLRGRKVQLPPGVLTVEELVTALC